MKFTKTVLPSGLRIVTIPMSDNPSVTVLVTVDAGSKYEAKDINGLSHFLEHMVFKGTNRRPKAVDISRELDSIGSHYNAFTSREYTGYYAKADRKHFAHVLDIVSDMYLDPIFDEAEIRKEKGVVIEEIRMYNDLPQERAYQAFMDLVYGDQPVGWDVIGTEANVSSFTRDQLVAYRRAHYVASATTIFVAGGFDEPAAIAAVSKAFAGISMSPKASKSAVIDHISAPRVAAVFKETDQTHLIIGLPTFSVRDPRNPAMSVLSTVLGRGMSSRLFSRLRDELGICYYVRAGNEAFTDHGLFSIGAGVDNSRVETAIKEILAQCALLKTDLVGADELKKAKDYISGTTALELETSEARAEFCAYQETVKGTIESPDEILARIQAVTAEDVQKLARDVFRSEALNMAIVGRFKDGSAFKPYFVI